MSQSDSSTLTLTPQDAGMELTHEEFAEADFQEPWRYERVNGKVVVMTPAGDAHRRSADPIRDYLGAYRLAYPDIVDRVSQESWVVIDEQNERLPDIAVYLQSDQVTPPIPERIPEIVFEIVSPNAADRRRDYEDKRTEYQRIGVREYVIVDRFEHRLLVLELEEGQYREMVLVANDSYRSTLLPGLEIPLEGIL